MRGRLYLDIVREGSIDRICSTAPHKGGALTYVGNKSSIELSPARSGGVLVAESEITLPHDKKSCPRRTAQCGFVCFCKMVVM